jgi:hypothetical protein
MRLPAFLLLAGLAWSASPVEAQRLTATRGGEQGAAYRGAQQGRNLTLPELRARIRVPNAQYIGAEMLGPTVYRLKFMRGPNVIWIDVDARTGNIVATTGL